MDEDMKDVLIEQFGIKNFCLKCQVERLKEQIREANNIIVKADWYCDYTLQSKCGFSDYLKKYDIKGII